MTILRGSTRWMLVVFGPFFVLVGCLNFVRDDVVAAVLAALFGVYGFIQGLRVRVEVGKDYLRYIGFFGTRRIERGEVTSIEAVFKGRSYAPVLTTVSGKRAYLSGLSRGSGVDRQVDELRWWLTRSPGH